MTSVIIPAHNEEGVLGNTLRTLLAGARPGELDVVVVANACRDNTVDVATRAGVRVIDTPVPGKAHAIRLGDAECRSFPRFVLDADIELTADGVRAMVDALARSGAMACAPVGVVDPRGASALAKRVHRVHEILVGQRVHLSGVGCYGLTEAGHARVFPVPDVLSDDGWVDRSFTGTERIVVDAARTVVRPAATVGAILRRRIRVRLGNQELDALGKRVPAGESLGLGSLREPLRRKEISMVDAACYVGVVVADKLFAKWRRVTGRTGSTWRTEREPVLSSSGRPSRG
jgi:glycosyltransferase involved in cell wall biosynthesis